MNNRINEIINKKFGTTDGYYYIIDQIREKWPYFSINEENLAKLNIVPMTEEYHQKTGFVGEYVAQDNKIKLYSDYGNEDELLETFVHELIHAITTKIIEGMIFEGLNMRTLDGRSSFVLYLNEGLTQFITNQILNTNESDAYPFETNIAEQFVCILGEENLLTAYSNQNLDGFVDLINGIDPHLDVIQLVSTIYSTSENVNYRRRFEDNMMITKLQETMIDLYKKGPMTDDERFSNLILDSEKGEKIINPKQLEGLVPPLDIYENGFLGIDDIDKKISIKK